jgi:8-oxo-dGTP diphosphatase
MWEWAKRQAEAEKEGEEVGKRVFRPLVNLYLNYPEMEHCLERRGGGS